MVNVFHPFSLLVTWLLELVLTIRLRRGVQHGWAKEPKEVLGTTTCKWVPCVAVSCILYLPAIAAFPFKNRFG